MSKSSSLSPWVLFVPINEKKALLTPIEPAEIYRALPDNNTAPGPDGLTTRQLRKIPIRIHVRIFNLLLLVGKMPKFILEFKTTLILKKEDASNSGNF